MLGAALHRLVLGVGPAQPLDLFVDLLLRDGHFGLGIDVEFLGVAKGHLGGKGNVRL